MRIVGVIDLQGGRAVHARGGRRHEYAPVAEAAGVVVNGDATALARAYVETLGVRELYVADLDAIDRSPAALQADVLTSVGACDVPVWVDAGVSSAESARRVLEAGASTVVVGLETLASFAALDEICAVVGGEAVAFSLDLRNGLPIALPGVAGEFASVRAVAARASESGTGTLVVLDLARVGTGAGLDLDLVADVRAAAPGVALFAGGGVRDARDLARLADAGCDGALVATALIEGRLAAR